MIQHPEYSEKIDDWYKWGKAYESGHQFVEDYVEIFSIRETAIDFRNRKDYSYTPAFAKAAIDEVKNSIFQRISDVTRQNGTASYMESILGRSGGVDLKCSTMNAFIGREVLPELLVKGKVGVYVDMPPLTDATRLTKSHPYLYVYKAEDILSWNLNYDDNGYYLTNLLLRNYKYSYDETFGLPDGTYEQYKLFQLTNEGVLVSILDYTEDAKVVPTNTVLLNLNTIPFAIAELNSSLMKDIADYQIALVNLASSDMSYALRSNFPFYTEQTDSRVNSNYLKNAETATQADSKVSAGKELNVGVADGRTYPMGAERPGFIHPSSEPLKASMDKQKQLKEEIKQLVQLALTNVDPKMASAESKQQDQQGLEAGLSYIGLELETLERQIAKIWCQYESSRNEVTIKYPKRYSMKSDNERREEAKELKEILHSVPSMSFKREIVKQIATIILGDKISQEKLNAILKDIDTAEIIDTDPDLIDKHIEIGILDLINGAKANGYPKEWVEAAKADHAERLARINEAQSRISGRGNPDLQNPGDDKLDKAKGQQTVNDDVVKDKTRGEANG